MRTELNRTAAAAAQLEWDLCDPFALDLRGAATELLAGNGDPAIPAGWAVIQRQGMTGGQVSNPERARVKNAVLGVGAATLAAWIGRATRAYTDATVGAADHYGAGGNGNVILSEAFTPVAGGVHGAVYEFREREVEMAMGRTDAVTGTLATLFGAA